MLPTIIIGRPEEGSHITDHVQHTGHSWVGLHYLVLGLFFLVVAGYYAVPLWDSDFWWHIASGRHILQHGIPDTDPFSVFPVVADVVRNDTVLKGQWLGQVVLYLLFELGGVNAVIAFRVSILLACLGLIYLRSRQLRVGSLVLWGVLILVGLNVAGFGGERPQLLSFLFAALFFTVIDQVEQTHDGRWLLALPVITVLWANSHGGVLLGVALLGLWSVLHWLDTETGRREKWHWLIVAVAVGLASLATPNGLQTYYYLLDLEGSVLQARTSEYVSSLQLYTLGHWWPQLWIYLWYAVALAAVITLARQHRWRPLAVVVFLGGISASSFRYFAFFLFVAAPYVAAGLHELMRARIDPSRRVAWVGNVLLVVLLLAVLVIGSARGVLFRGGLYQPAYPVAIADFVARQVAENGLQGRAFNNMEWGGYLLWRLPPQVQLFIDGRMLDETRFPSYTHMLWATPQGVRLFEQAKFRLVILPYHGRYDPQRYQLIDYLASQAGWRLAYRDAAGVVFVRH
jgi:hypothetical protein